MRVICHLLSNMIKSVLVLICLASAFFSVQSCNEALCGPVVSKCLLTQSCQCDLQNNRTCSSLCFSCLGSLYTECCVCFDMCPKTIDELVELNRVSHVEDLMYPVPQLFEVLVEAPDSVHGWTSEKFPVQLSVQKADAGTDPVQDAVSVNNCSVAFWNQCMSYKKCKDSCISMGSSSLRFFHDGCCECIGDTCINYGVNESRCQLCPLNDVIVTASEDNELDYGEEDYEE